jgi:hypothetical protein
MKDKELEIVVEELESRVDLSTADFDAVVNALHYMMPDRFAATPNLDRHVDTLDGALRYVSQAYPNWVVDIHGAAQKKGGHWRCTLREGDTSDNDAAIGLGNAPVPSQAVLAALIRLTATLKKL